MLKNTEQLVQEKTEQERTNLKNRAKLDDNQVNQLMEENERKELKIKVLQTQIDDFVHKSKNQDSLITELQNQIFQLKEENNQLKSNFPPKEDNKEEMLELNRDLILFKNLKKDIDKLISTNN